MNTATDTVPNELAQNLKAAEEDKSVRYDASAKKRIAERSVLAYILKSALAEYEPYTVREIAERFIEGEPEIGTLAVHRDHPDRTVRSRTTTRTATPFRNAESIMRHA